MPISLSQAATLLGKSALSVCPTDLSDTLTTIDKIVD